MAGITQTVPNYIQGISQQPDELKLPGQVSDALNVLPNITKGLEKRPGSEFIKTLDLHGDELEEGKYFLIDQDKKYIGRVDKTGFIQVWDLSGNEYEVVQGERIDANENTVSTYENQPLSKAYEDAEVKAINITNGGSGYTSTPTVAITNTSGSTGSGATATANVEGGVVTSITITNKGSNYSAGASVAITGGGGSNATATATIGALPYLQHTKSDSIQYLTINDYTFFTNRERKVAMSEKVKNTLIDDRTLTSDGLENTPQIDEGGKDWIYYKDNVRPKEAFVELKQIAYNKQYSLNFHDPTNDFEVDQNVATKLSVEWLGSAGTSYTEGGQTKTTKDVDWALPPENDLDDDDFIDPDWGKYHKKTQDGTCRFTARKVFTINPTGKSVYSGDEADRTKYGQLVLNTNANRSLDTGSTGYNPHPNTRGDMTNLRFELKNIGTPHAVQRGKNANDATYECMYETNIKLMHGGEGWRKGDNFVVVMEDTNYRITVEEHKVERIKANIAKVRPEPTASGADEIITADGILDQIIADFDRRANLKDQPSIDDNTPEVSGPGWPWNTRKIGNGIYFRFYEKDKIDGLENAADAITLKDFTVTAPNKNLFNILTSEVNNVGDLPTQCRHGYVVKVLNSNSEKDDYYLQFKSNTAPFDGAGVWEECPKPGLRNEFARDTMPHQLVEKLVPDLDNAGQYITKFYLEPIDYMPSVCGDEETNPIPSFINETTPRSITNIAFFRNRLAFLSGDSVVLSQSGDYFNFWAKTGMTISPADCIDVAVSATSPATLLDAIAVQRGLLLFSKEQQFMLTTDNDVLRPETAKVVNISTYSYNSLVKPFSMGTSVGFTNNTTSNSRFMEMTNIQAGTSPDVLEQSKLVHSMLPAAIDSVAESKEQGLVLFATSDTSDMVYGYKWFNTGERRILASWFKWQLHGNVIFHTIVDDIYYAIVRADDQSVQLEKIDIKNQPKITTRSGDYLVHLDNMTLISTMSYSSSTKKTTVTIPDNFTVTGAKKFTLFATAGTMAGQAEYPVISGTTVTIPGDWTSSVVYAGYIYKMQVQFPTNFLKSEEGEAVRAESRGSTIVHRVKLNFGSIGYFQTRLERKSRPDWIQDYEMSDNCNFDPNCFGILPNARQTIPIYSRNEDYRLYLESIHTSPCTLHSSSWEGDYNNKFYRKV